MPGAGCTPGEMEFKELFWFIKINGVQEEDRQGTGQAAGQSNLIVQIEKLLTLIIWLNLSNAFNIEWSNLFIYPFYFIDLNLCFLFYV